MEYDRGVALLPTNALTPGLGVSGRSDVSFGSSASVKVVAGQLNSVLTNAVAPPKGFPFTKIAGGVGVVGGVGVGDVDDLVDVIRSAAALHSVDLSRLTVEVTERPQKIKAVVDGDTRTPARRARVKKPAAAAAAE